MKRIIAVMLVLVLSSSLLYGCGSKEDGANLEGTCAEILDKVYAEADLDQDLRDSMDSFENIQLDMSNEENIIATSEIAYTDSVYSAPMMSSIAYQCVLLRLKAGQDVEKAKSLLKENANPAKWICVEAESVVVENVGDVILYIMADEATAAAVKDAFLALK